ncbi:MAG: peptide deformylase [Gemmatimonadetes bacterium]|nr:peptide deformylase [Gemmatimonadota bacterium]
MAIRKIELLGAPVLRRRAAEVEAAGEEIRALVQDLWDTMYDAPGVGLAAPQIGVSLRVLVADVRQTDPEAAPGVALVNPRVVEASEETSREVEGCLSIPGLEEVVERPARVVIEGTDVEGRPLRLEAGGMFARALQHEIDHLDGILFLDRLSPLKRKMLVKKWKKAKTRPAATPPA